MKRFVLFLLLFPAIATVAFYAVLYVLTGAELDSASAPVAMYLAFTVPGLLVGLLDGLLARWSFPAIITTTLVTYGLSVMTMILLLGASPQVIALGLIGGIPAGICAWLSSRSNETAPSPMSPA